jgi:hypothetical protein
LAEEGVPAILDSPGDFVETYGSAGYAGSLDDLSNALTTVADKFFRGQNYETYFGDADGFAAKYGESGLNQIIANINDAVLPSTDDSFTGATTDDMLGVPDNNGTNCVPRLVFGNRPSPFINEVAVAVAQFPKPPIAQGADPTLEIQVWMQCELVDPYATGEGQGWEIKYNIGSLRFSGTYTLNGVQGTFSNSAFSDPWSWQGSDLVLSNSTEMQPNAYVQPGEAFAFEWQIVTNDGNSAQPAIPLGAQNLQVTSVEVVPALVVLTRNVGDPLSVRDWAFGPDFTEAAGHFEFLNPPVALQPLQPVGGAGGWGPNDPAAYGINFNAIGRSIAKNDPRVRRFADFDPPQGAPAWAAAPSSLGLPNPTVNFTVGTGVDGLANDAPGSAVNIFQHPSVLGGAANFTLGRPNWISVFDLSRIHTGLQWRTLQFRSQSQQESAADLVPDWALLEAFVVSGGPARPYKLNINSLAYPAADGSAPAALLAVGLGRAPTAGSLLTGMTTTNAPTAMVGTNNLGFPSSAGFATAADAMRVGTNIAALTFTNTWANRRADNTNYQQNLYTLPSEVLEVNGVSNFSTDEAANEARAQGVYSGITVASQVFTVYSAGYANDRQGNETAEARVRAQVARDPASGRFRVIFLEPLIWP